MDTEKTVDPGMPEDETTEETAVNIPRAETSDKELKFVSAGTVECGPIDEEIGGRHCSGTVTVDITRKIPVGTKMTACIGFQGTYGSHSGCILLGHETVAQSPPGKVTFSLSDQNGVVICPPTLTFIDVNALGDRLGDIEGLSIPVKCG